ncbi:methyltransferase [uncultured Cohaesibacter sp.]|uniref:class I SAM-dependent DNA methyltransferase n=1 Tax=uncultured Cohaesibacter sp. TaxID=1002546 RepID=UPI0029C6313D|nr:methyltransferase [uncultured Cohaesibacter sp.]
MVGKPFPSGNLLADRRAEFAATMAQMGDWASAIEVLTGALEEAPDWGAGWFQLGEYHEQAHDAAKAAEAWRRAIALDPSDPFGAGLKLDLLRDVPVAERMPAAFVETLFDQYAPRFEESLLEKLDYRGPELLLSALRESGFGHACRALDLGCGTGLMGVQLRDCCDWLGGYDISRGMLDEAESKGLYDLLEKHDLGDLAPGTETYDLIVAADVFIYLGALEQIVGWCVGALAPEGRLAFTLERGDKPIELRESRRFAHSPAYVTELLQHAGFHDIAMQDCVLRQDRGADIQSFCVVASLKTVKTDRDLDGEEQVLA